MTMNINDVSVLLNTLRSAERHGIEQTLIMGMIQEKYVYIEWKYDPAVVLDTATMLNLVKIDNGLVRLTDDGNTVASMGGHNIDLTGDQISYIAEHCVFDNPNFLNFVDFLGLFVFDSNRKTLVYNTTEYPVPDIQTDLFVQLGILSKDHSVFILDPEYVLHVDHSFNRVFDREHLDSILAEQNAVGDLGETLSLNYEKTRLSGLGLDAESNSVVRISLTDVAAGYDIKSFEGSSFGLKHDMFVEVKARKKYLRSFIMSTNEIRVAKRLGSKYVIHFWAGLAHHEPSAPTMIIRDPVQALSIKECPCCLSYLIPIAKEM